MTHLAVGPGFDVVIGDRILETTQTTATNAYQLDGVSVAGRVSFVNGVGNGSQTIYVCEAGSQWEIGVGTVAEGAPATLSREFVLASSNGGALVNWAPGVKNIYGDVPADLAMQIIDPARVDDLEARQAELDGQIAAFQGAKMVFVQATAPEGWVQDTSRNDRVLRIVDDDGGGIGGSWTITGLSAVGHSLTIDEMPSHDHSIGFRTNSSAGGSPTFEAVRADTAGGTNHAQPTGDRGGGDPHSHGVSSTGFWRPSYQDAIVCEAQTWLTSAPPP